ncbi:DALR anticodon-binding domain-containing protein 3 [Bradysia coprophila]|uniref:DALR anticodon-binding domain-containing protein 3 n=1 Tax=Bradysia coprophila TaxID=38358 RepID=UPI00187DDAAC|nr:DALR anticodon-binding domain-containing protein 3 [Bradysia coprophila]
MCRNEEFIKEIFHYFINDPCKYTTNNVIKRHTKNLSEFGDYSFPINTQNWAQFLPPLQHLSVDNIFDYRQRCDDKFESITDHIKDFVQNSRKWTLQIEQAVINDTRCAIFLNRYSAFQLTLTTVLNNPNYGCYEGDQTYAVVRNDTDPGDKEPLTKYRCRVIQNVIVNLTKHLKGSTQKSLYVTHKSTDSGAPQGSTKILVGNVTSTDNKVLNVDATDYIQKRSVDMQLMAQHKYGLRVKNELFFQNLINSLGKAAVTIDLLEVRPSGSLKLNMSGCSTGRSKGASFILYNSARIETLLKKYDHGVATKFYPETPPLDRVDLALLKEEEEWILLFNYVLAYPSLINQTIGENNKLTFSLHLLCMFLSGLASTFSIYYARTRILTENRPQLMPALHARIYLLKSIQIILNKCLAILNIDPVKQM